MAEPAASTRFGNPFGALRLTSLDELYPSQAEAAKSILRGIYEIGCKSFTQRLEQRLRGERDQRRRENRHRRRPWNREDDAASDAPRIPFGVASQQRRSRL
jgi:hypothetical protein